MTDHRLVQELRFCADEIHDESPKKPVAKLHLSHLLARAADAIEGPNGPQSEAPPRRYWYDCTCGNVHEMGTTPACGGGYLREAAPDVSLAATPAREDVANGLQILYGTRDGYAKDRDPRALIDGFEAVARLLRAALHKLEAK